MPYINDIFIGAKANGYWSNTPDMNNENYAWNVDFDNGITYSDIKTYNYNVRCVR